MGLFSACANKAFSATSGIFTQEDKFGVGFKKQKAPAHKQGHRRWAAEGMHHPRPKRGLGGKMARVTFQSKPFLGLVFHH